MINSIFLLQATSRPTSLSEALRHIKEDKTIVLEEADKGGAIVVMDSDYCKDKILIN